MTTYISILRGINVGGHKLIKMDTLRNMYESLNFKDVKTYVQSGNVIFSYNKTDLKELEDIISKQIEKNLGHIVPVIVLTKEKLMRIIEQNPFSKDPEKDSSFLHVTFLANSYKEFNKDIFEEKKQVGEDFQFNEDAIYLYCPKGYGETKLNNNFIESKLKVKASTRNWKTTIELLNIATEYKM